SCAAIEKHLSLNIDTIAMIIPYEKAKRNTLAHSMHNINFRVFCEQWTRTQQYARIQKPSVCSSIYKQGIRTGEGYVLTQRRDVAATRVR
ncbi:MAG: hypothetical protein M3Z24_15470, partial [Chloroflexota bacterium]|nr:hypothetical protein [Chloroflexota bacterium]